MMTFEKVGDFYWVTLTLEKEGIKVENFFSNIHEALIWRYEVIQTGIY